MTSAFPRFMRLAAMAIAVAFAGTALAQTPYPKQKPITLIVAQAPGSATDQMARILAGKMSEALGQQIVIDNKAGAGGALGAELAAKAAPDGYTLLLASISTHGINPALYRSLPYDPVGGFTPIGWSGLTGNVIVVNAELPIRTLPELIAHAKANPDQLTFATAGNGSSQHLATELFAAMAGNLKMLHVPYRGSGPMMTAVMSGESSWMMPAIPSGLTAVRSGKVRPLAVSLPQRSPDFPDVPTIAETIPGYEVTTWYGLVGPAGLPADVVKTLNDAIKSAMTNEEALKSLAAAGLQARTSTPEEFGAHISSEIERWKKVAADANIKLD